jgi:pSer/pThr/pTyr-binding forkhead associated (FHA) protein
MNAKITLAVVRGSLEGDEFTLDCNNRFLIGRGEDCDIKLPREVGPLDISRHHCLLETTTRRVYIHDLGSLHGTYVNGELIGQRPAGQPCEAADPSRCRTRELKDGDEILVGNTLLRIAIDVSADILEPAYAG